MRYKGSFVLSPLFVIIYIYMGFVFYYELVAVLGKIRLFIRGRSRGFRIDSVPMRELLRLSKSSRKSWVFQETIDGDGWLILEAY